MKDNKSVCTRYGIEIFRDDIKRFQKGYWLNDNVMNFFFNLILEREKNSNRNIPSVHAFDTYFLKMFRGRGFAGVKGRTKKVDVFKKDFLLIPINLETERHWSLVVVDFKIQTVYYLDSLGFKKFVKFRLFVKIFTFQLIYYL